MRKLVIFFAFLLCLSSCATQKKVEYVDREVVRYETQYVHDTVRTETHDSIYHTVFQKEDTVYDTKYIEHIKWRDRIVERIDTVKVDNVQTEYFETVIEEKVVPKWCYVSLFISLIFIIYFFVKFKKLLC